ncbi:ATP synthase epsilon chain [Buchnera aphidicola (Takecallis arundicolens)]|uniref:ATP synthase F1 subunit epsilon n=1 Tax=Buchnera aphidicola TaxID=9 RepID=UPI003463EF3D
MDCYLNVVSIKKHLFSGHIKKIYITGYKGVLNIYPGHTPLLTTIKPGLLSIFTISKKKLLYISYGILEVQPSVINILPDEGCFLSDLNYDKLIYKKKYMEKKILQLNETEKKNLQIKLLDIQIQIKLLQEKYNID